MNKKKIIILIATTILLISAILYQILYKNYQKNEIISEVNKTASNIDVQPITEVKEITVFVDVSGEVKEPGLYELKENMQSIINCLELSSSYAKKIWLFTVVWIRLEI